MVAGRDVTNCQASIGEDLEVALVSKPAPKTNNTLGTDAGGAGGLQMPETSVSLQATGQRPSLLCMDLFLSLKSKITERGKGERKNLPSSGAHSRWSQEPDMGQAKTKRSPTGVQGPRHFCLLSQMPLSAS